MLSEVLHHPEVDLLHICYGVHQTLSWEDMWGLSSHFWEKPVKGCTVEFRTLSSTKSHFYFVINKWTHVDFFLSFLFMTSQFMKKDKNSQRAAQGWITCVNMLYCGGRTDKIHRRRISWKLLTVAQIFILVHISTYDSSFPREGKSAVANTSHTFRLYRSVWDNWASSSWCGTVEQRWHTGSHQRTTNKTNNSSA